MLGLSWSELTLIAVAALLILGPKDLPHIMRHLGFLMRKARNAVTGFQEEMESLSYQDEINRLKNEVNKLHKEIATVAPPPSDAVNTPSSRPDA